MEAWLKASRLRLNPSKVQVMWLVSQQLLSAHPTHHIVHVSILSSIVHVDQ